APHRTWLGSAELPGRASVGQPGVRGAGDDPVRSLDRATIGPRPRRSRRQATRSKHLGSRAGRLLRLPAHPRVSRGVGRPQSCREATTNDPSGSGRGRGTGYGPSLKTSRSAFLAFRLDEDVPLVRDRVLLDLDEGLLGEHEDLVAVLLLL